MTELLASVLAGVCRAVPGEIGTAVSVAHPDPRRGAGRLQVLAATGIGAMLTPITTGHLWGPALTAATSEEPILTADLWHDPRWPHLSPDTIRDYLSEEEQDAVLRVRGAAAMPGVWNDDGVVVLSVYLDCPAEEHTVAELARHERLVASAVTIADVATHSVEDAEKVLDTLAARAFIEQAKGSIMTLRRCDASQAWGVLRRASQECNVKVRELALAYVEHLGHAPAEQPEDPDSRVTASPAARKVAPLLWQALTGAAPAAAPSPR